MTIQERLFALQDPGYAEFQSKLTPGIAKELFIGVRVPEVRKLAAACKKEEEAREFLHTLPHMYYDENMLHGMLISEMKDFDECIEAVDAFLPYVDNWAVCDTMKPKCMKKHLPETLLKIREWTASEKTYTCRFGMEMLMNFYLDKEFLPEYLEIPAAVHSEEYYVQMMQAWFYATALAKQWDATIPYMTENRLDVWVHNKTIQKARESFRITSEQKEYLKTLKR